MPETFLLDLTFPITPNEFDLQIEGKITFAVNQWAIYVRIEALVSLLND